LQIRHEEKLQLQIINNHNGDGMIVPCSLQLLIENAIKHNAFSSEHPLIIKIELDDETICISNNTQPKITIPHSTKIGLANLDHRYQLICHKKIIVEEKSNYFFVKLPIIKQNTLISR
ncbi:MAG: histidine kinase, partial [Flavisolibacter sp.]|nr:histidine kinase [Flavisolibacter sp.]